MDLANLILGLLICWLIGILLYVLIVCLLTMPDNKKIDQIYSENKISEKKSIRKGLYIFAIIYFFVLLAIGIVILYVRNGGYNL